MDRTIGCDRLLIPDAERETKTEPPSVTRLNVGDGETFGLFDFEAGTEHEGAQEEIGEGHHDIEVFVKREAK